MKLTSKIFLGLALAACFGFVGCGGGDTSAPKTTPPATDKADDKTPDNAANDSGASNGEMVLVSLTLPKMT